MIFALIYKSMPSNSFYHPTARFEPYISQDAESIREGLQAAIQKNLFEAYGGTSRRLAGGWQLRYSDVYVTGIQASNASVTVRLGYFLRQSSTDASQVGFFGGGVSAVLPLPQANVAARDQVTYVGFELVPTELLPVDQGIAASVLFPNPTDPQGQGPLLPVPVAVHNQLVALVSAEGGFPSRSSGELGRMLYLSTTTITTLGYGDIVPVTDKARAATASEAIIGIILIGLFINAVAAPRRAG